jgi:hypothetical protein
MKKIKIHLTLKYVINKVIYLKMKKNNFINYDKNHFQDFFAINYVFINYA